MGLPPLCPIADPLSKMRYHKYPWTPNPSSGNTYIKHFRSSLYHLPPPTSSGFNKFRKAVKICIPIRNHTLFLCGIRSYRQVQQKQNSIKTRMPHRKILSYRTVFLYMQQILNNNRAGQRQTVKSALLPRSEISVEQKSHFPLNSFHGLRE